MDLNMDNMDINNILYHLVNELSTYYQYLLIFCHCHDHGNYCLILLFDMNIDVNIIIIIIIIIGLIINNNSRGPYDLIYFYFSSPFQVRVHFHDRISNCLGLVFFCLFQASSLLEVWSCVCLPTQIFCVLYASEVQNLYRVDFRDE